MRYLILFLSLIFIIGCSDTKEESTNGNRVDSNDDNTVDVKTFTINIAGLDNLIVKDVIPAGPSNLSFNSVMFAENNEGNIFTNDDGQIFVVELPPGHLVKKTHSVKGASNRIALTFYIESTSDTITATCVLSTEDGICDPELYEPRKMSNRGNAPFYQKNGDIIRYLTSDSLIEYSEITKEKTITAFSENGQLSINNNGHMMIDTGSEISINASFDMVIPDVPTMARLDSPAELFPNTKKFFLPHKSGFLVQGGTRGDFYRISDSSGDLDVKFAQYNAYYQYINVDGGFNRITSNTGLSNCTSHIVGDDDIMICNDDIYLIGDASNDIEHKNINYSGHTIFDLTIRAGNSLYIYSKSELNNWYKLTREDVFNETSELITDNYRIIPECFDIIDSSTDTIYVGTVRISDDENIILKINSADSTPDIIETIGECDQIVSF